MIEKFKTLVDKKKILLIEGESGAGKTLLASFIVLEKMKEGKKCLFLSFLNTELLKKGLKEFFGEEFEKAVGKNLIFGQLDLGNEKDFFEDVEFALKNFNPDILVIDPLHPSLTPGELMDICNLLRAKNVAGIFCSTKREELHAVADYVLYIVFERVKGDMKREIVLKCKEKRKEETYSLSIIPGKIIIESHEAYESAPE